MGFNQIGCFIFRKNSGFYEFLILKRVPEKGGFWQGITGMVENETLKQAVLREAKEEIGLESSEVIQLIEGVNIFKYKNQKSGLIVTEHVFGLEVKPDQKILLDKNIYPEHDEFKWVPLEEALKLLHFESSKESITKLSQILNQLKSWIQINPTHITLLKED